MTTPSSRHTSSRRGAPDPAPPAPITPPYPADGSSYAARESLTMLLSRELLGPADGEDELSRERPDQRYLVGKLAPRRLAGGGGTASRRAPQGALRTSGTVEEPDDTTVVADEGADAAEDAALRRGIIHPTSMGLRCQVDPGQQSLTVTVRWGTYAAEKTGEVTRSGADVRAYRRTQHTHEVGVPVGRLTPFATHTIEVDGDVVLRVDVHDDDDPQRGAGRRVVELALCHDAERPDGPIPLTDWLFQTELVVSAAGAAALLPVRDALVDPAPPIPDDAPDRDEQLRLELQYRDRLEYAIGRTCSVTWTEDVAARAATEVRTTWLPQAETPQVTAPPIPGAMLDMRALAVAEPAELRAGLTPMLDGYLTWLGERQAEAADLPERLRATADDAIDEARLVHAQLAEGIDLLTAPAGEGRWSAEQQDEALRCFRFMCEVMAEQRVHSQISTGRADDSRAAYDAAVATVVELKERAHSWRPFQLAFVLMQLPALTDPTLPRRSGADPSVQLLFFPTGGGKTEAYLGLAAYTFAIRRRQGVVESVDGPLDGRDGVAVLMRYTLRLLTAQQFQRATTLICAAERVRAADPQTWGAVPFRIGLWVGSAVTPKRVGEAAAGVAAAHERGTKRLPVLQLRRCPWCGHSITPAQVRVDEAAGRVFVRCGDPRQRCPFAEGGEVRDGLPVLTTDEEIYRLTPAFVVGTVDKFARLAREGEAAALFGYVGERCERHGYVHPDSTACTIAHQGRHPAKGGLPAARRLPHSRLRPPDLVIQDELHLITGALGTTVGLFEVAIDVLTTWERADGATVRPLVVASSATVRNAAEQVTALYGRGLTVFPPQVLDASETYFSTEVEPTPEHPGRRYVGVTTPGSRYVVGEIRLAELLLAGGQLALDTSGPAGDPYATLVAYFNTVRELAGLTRYLGDDVTTVLRTGRRGVSLPRRYGTTYAGLHTAELTGRVSGSDITSTLDQMALPFDPDLHSTAARHEIIAARRRGEQVRRADKNPYDAVLATSMLQVGVDVTRLGLMLVVGQPKNTAEYIQASSRVGRDADRPGLVVTLGNWARPRDLAHFESFEHYHDRFYAQVEALSVTPFSATALERGLDAILVSAARVLDGGDPSDDSLSPERGAARVDDRWDHLTGLVDRLVDRVEPAADAESAAFARSRLLNRLDHWRQRRADAVGSQLGLVYERSRSGSQALFRSAEDSAGLTMRAGLAPFVVANSMREVQPEINLLLSPLPDRLVLRYPHEPQWQPADPPTTTRDDAADDETEEE